MLTRELVSVVSCTILSDCRFIFPRSMSSKDSAAEEQPSLRTSEHTGALLDSLGDCVHLLQELVDLGRGLRTLKLLAMKHFGLQLSDGL